MEIKFAFNAFSAPLANTEKTNVCKEESQTRISQKVQ